MDDINLGVVIAQIINFLILFFLLKYLLGDKLVKLVHERKNQLDKIDNIDSDVKMKLDQADEQANEIISEARKKALEIEASSENLAKKTKEKMLSDAEMRAESILAGAKSDIEKERLSMMNTLKSKVIDVSLKLNAKLFASEKVNKDFMEKELNSINL